MHFLHGIFLERSHSLPYLLHCNMDCSNRSQELTMRNSTPRFEIASEAEIMRQAEALRGEMIRTFFAGLFAKRENAAPVYPAHAAPAE